MDGVAGFVCPSKYQEASDEPSFMDCAQGKSKKLGQGDHMAPLTFPPGEDAIYDQLTASGMTALY